MIHQKLNGTESQRTPKEVTIELLDTQVFSGSVKRGSCWRFLGNEDEEFEEDEEDEEDEDILWHPPPCLNPANNRYPKPVQESN